jgi:replicative DNA helicase
VLGSILIVPALVEDLVVANLRSSDFYLDANRRIYRRILDLAQSSRPVDSISLAEELNAHQELELIGGYAYLSDLADLAVPERKHVSYHAAIIMTKAKLRRIQLIGERAQSAAGAPGADPEKLGRQVVDQLENVLSERKDEARHLAAERAADSYHD